VSYVGLALLSAGDPQYLPAIQKDVGFIRGHHITGIDLNDPKVGPRNWIAGAAPCQVVERTGYWYFGGDGCYT